MLCSYFIHTVEIVFRLEVSAYHIHPKFLSTHHFVIELYLQGNFDTAFKTQCLLLSSRQAGPNTHSTHVVT